VFILILGAAEARAGRSDHVDEHSFGRECLVFGTIAAAVDGPDKTSQACVDGRRADAKSWRRRRPVGGSGQTGSKINITA
jgi:hypothetical protein